MQKVMEDLHFMRLWDKYSPLLTETQREITNLYFNCDLSLSEIAEQLNCSRQSVSDCLATCRKKFEAYEKKLQFQRMETEISLHLSFLTTDLGRAIEDFPQAYKEKIEEILNRDYSQEVAKAIAEHSDMLL